MYGLLLFFKASVGKISNRFESYLNIRSSTVRAAAVIKSIRNSYSEHRSEHPQVERHFRSIQMIDNIYSRFFFSLCSETTLPVPFQLYSSEGRFALIMSGNEERIRFRNI